MVGQAGTIDIEVKYLCADQASSLEILPAKTLRHVTQIVSHVQEVLATLRVHAVHPKNLLFCSIEA
jgi:hypothetical protein